MDQISVKTLKEAADILVYLLAKIVSLSIKVSELPVECQTAKLRQLFKKDSTTDPRNYRSISLLSLVRNQHKRMVYSINTIHVLEHTDSNLANPFTLKK